MIAWSRRRTLMAGIGLIVVVNAMALAGVAYNRSGAPMSLVQLSERELHFPNVYAGRVNRTENSGVALNLQWRVPAEENGPDYEGYGSYGGSPSWLNQAKLTALGFEGLSAKKLEHGERSGLKKQQTKEVLLVLELDGAAARKALEFAREKAAKEEKLNDANPGNTEFALRSKAAKERLERETQENSRLFAVDAGLDVAELRTQYPDRTHYLIVRGQVRPQFVSHEKVEQLRGVISALSIDQINVPVEFQPILLRATPNNVRVKFSATVAFGQRLEPWITALSGEDRTH